MLNMIKGCQISDPSLLQEGYQQTEYGYCANVNAEKIRLLVERFITLHNEPCFLILEVPARADTAPVWTEVYYMDGLSVEAALELLNTYGELLVHDGLVSFGIGLHSGNNEIMVEKYNCVTVYTKTSGQYNGFFEQLDIPEVWDLKTAWDYFDDETPGDSFLYRWRGKTIYDLVELLKNQGLYLAECREEYV